NQSSSSNAFEKDHNRVHSADYATNHSRQISKPSGNLINAGFSDLQFASAPKNYKQNLSLNNDFLDSGPSTKVSANSSDLGNGASLLKLNQIKQNEYLNPENTLKANQDSNTEDPSYNEAVSSRESSISLNSFLAKHQELNYRDAKPITPDSQPKNIIRSSNPNLEIENIEADETPQSFGQEYILPHSFISPKLSPRSNTDFQKINSDTYFQHNPSIYTTKSASDSSPETELSFDSSSIVLAHHGDFMLYLIRRSDNAVEYVVESKTPYITSKDIFSLVVAVIVLQFLLKSKKDFGLQIESYTYIGFKSVKFIESKRIKDIVIHEALTFFQYKFFLSVIVEDSEDAAV
ncbi:hypothetical protein BB560_003912, partial [Smittium megazygosporum]